MRSNCSVSPSSKERGAKPKAAPAADQSKARSSVVRQTCSPLKRKRGMRKWAISNNAADARTGRCTKQGLVPTAAATVSYTHLRAHETRHDLVCRLLLE